MTTKIDIEINEDKLKELCINYLSEILNIKLSESEVSIQVKSKQNYRSEWEEAAFKAKINLLK